MSAEAPPILPPAYTPVPDLDHALLGAGGAATVWRVRDAGTGAVVALKVLRAAGSGAFHARLEREAILCARVVHPNVISLHDVGRTPDGRSFIAFALANAGSLLDVATDPPPWPALSRLMVELLAGLGAMHARGILHLDVKLSNLLLHCPTPDAPPVAWLADLGVARAFRGEAEEDRTVVGTVSYMAAERLCGQHHLWGPPTDLFAVGAVLYRLLTGRLPFPAKDARSGLDERLRGMPPLAIRAGYAVPAGIEEVVSALLAPDPRHRFDTAADAIRAIQALGSPARTAGAGPAGRRAAAADVPPWFRPAPLPFPDQPPEPAPAAPIPQAPGLLVHREIPLIGRGPELELLWRAARTAARTRRPVLVEVTGPSGAGTTRIVEELVRRLEEAGLAEGLRLPPTGAGAAGRLRAAWSTWFPPGSAPDLFRWELVSGLARDRGQAPDSCREDAAELQRLLAPEKAGAAPPRRAVARTMLVEVLERRAWRGLSWIWVEDAGALDENDDVWAIIDDILSRAAPVVVFVTTRAGAAPHALAELRARHPRAARTLSLAPLDGRSAESLVHAHLPLEPTLAARLARSFGPHPRALRGLLAAWVRQGALADTTAADTRTWSLQPGVPVPADAAELAAWRLSTLGDDPTRRHALRLLHLAGAGVPEAVVARLVGDAVDALVVQGLVRAEAGRLALDPPALGPLLAADLDAATTAGLHGALAHAWSRETAHPEALAELGRHRALAGDHAGAVSALDAALATLGPTLSVHALAGLATLLDTCITAAGDAGPAAEAAQRRARRAGAEAAARAGDDAEAARLDATLLEVARRPDEALLAQAEAARRSPAAALRARAALDAARPTAAAAPVAVRAAHQVALAYAAAEALDVEPALADLREALAATADPALANEARLLRARLLRASDPVVAWNECLRTIEVARDHGLLRHEVLAWGLIGEELVALGHAEEALERLRSGIDRLLAQGERRAAQDARLALVRVQCAAGRMADARKTGFDALTGGPPSLGGLDAPALLGLLGAVAADAEDIRARRPASPGSPATAVAWLLLDTLAARLAGERAPLPAVALQAAPALGPEGLFLARATLALRPDAVDGRATFIEAARRAGVEPFGPDPWLDRFDRARR